MWPLYVKERVFDGVLADRFPVVWKALEPHFGKRARKGKPLSAKLKARDLAMRTTGDGQ